ncbi:MAG: NosD domain-containing protein [Promethearchaeota archaeon]
MKSSHLLSFLFIVLIFGVPNLPIYSAHIQSQSSQMNMKDIHKIEKPLDMSDIINVDNIKSVKTQYSRIKGISSVSPSNYVDQDPISINGNADFLAQAAQEKWNGTGSPMNPIIISNYSISNSSSNLLEIKNTDLYFEIKNNLLSNFERTIIGIFLSNTTNGLIFNNSVRGCVSSIKMDSCFGNNISSNTIQNNTNSAIYLTNSIKTFISNNDFIQSGGISQNYLSKNNTITNNLFINCSGGIGAENRFDTIKNNFLIDSGSIEVYGNTTVFNNTIMGKGGILMRHREGDYNIICNNRIINSTEIGIFIEYSRSNFVSNNTIVNCRKQGIAIGECEYNVICNNRIINNTLEGIFLYLSSDNSVSNNTIVNCKDDGIGIHDSSNYNNITDNQLLNNNGKGIGLYRVVISHPYHPLQFYPRSNLIERNDFIGNGLGGGSQAYDDYGSPNIFRYNYWDEWTSPDENLDGIVDNNYFMGGYYGGNYDYYPLAAPNHLIKTAYLTRPRVLYPNSGEEVNGTVLIQWAPANHSFNQSISYNVYYYEHSWKLLFSSLNTTNCLWDTADLFYGENYLIKVIAVSLDGLMSADRSDVPLTILNDYIWPPVITRPIGGIYQGIIRIDWRRAHDSWSHSITYATYYSPDNGTTWLLITSVLIQSHCNWDTTKVSNGSGYRVKVVATCSAGLTAEAISESFTIQNSISTTDTPSFVLYNTFLALSALSLFIFKRKSKFSSKDCG